jgi:hypothetical protein
LFCKHDPQTMQRKKGPPLSSIRTLHSNVVFPTRKTPPSCSHGPLLSDVNKKHAISLAKQWFANDTNEKKGRLLDSIQTLHSSVVLSTRKHCHCAPTASIFQGMKRFTHLRAQVIFRGRMQETYHHLTMSSSCTNGTSDNPFALILAYKPPRIQFYTN